MLIIALLAAGRHYALPSTAQYPAPVASAAQPAVSGRGDLAYARKAAAALRTALKDLAPAEALERIPAEGLNLEEPAVAAACAAAPGPLPALVCHYGPVASQPVAQAILWHEGDVWHWQLYPQASDRLAAERREHLTELGCRLGCYSSITQARQAAGAGGPELLVVVNLGFTSANKAEEVQLLQYANNSWRVMWVPGGGDWNYGHAEVTLAAKGLVQFDVHSSSWLRQDRMAEYLAEPEGGEHRRFLERWVRKSQGYMMKDQTEDPGPYRSLVRVVYYLSAGADEKVQPLLAQGVALEDARKALAQRPKRQGWTVTRWGQSGYLLDTQKSGKPDLGVRFELQGDDWVLAEIWNAQR